MFCGSELERLAHGGQKNGTPDGGLDYTMYSELYIVEMRDGFKK